MAGVVAVGVEGWKDVGRELGESEMRMCVVAGKQRIFRFESDPADYVSV